MASKQSLGASLGRMALVLGALWWAAAPLAGQAAAADEETTAVLKRTGPGKGVCVVLGLTQSDRPGPVIDLAKRSEGLFYFQSPDADQCAAVRNAADAEGLLGTRVFVDQGDWRSIHLADNLAGAVIAAPSAREAAAEQEILRVLHPEGIALLGDRELVKSFPEGLDAWSHPYHGPDNNPQSTDQRARAPYLTQFLAEPMFCPMPEVSVAAGGRVFRAFGHIAHKANQNRWLNTLVAVNGYNGIILWQRELKEGFMIHRNTMIATPEVLYLADDESCKRIDARTGRLKDEITLPEGLADGPVWKWMALDDGVLYALIGGPEVKPPTQPSNTPGLGHWPWGMWPGHDYKDPKTSFGFGRTLVAIDPDTKRVLWSHREDEYLDSRGVCMKGGRIYCYSPQKFLACLDAGNGKVLWKTSARDLLEAIGPEGRAQHYVTGYSTTTYMKCNDEYILFAGPHRSRLVVCSAEDGKLLWQRENGNLHLVLREDGFYAVGPGDIGCKLAYESGEVLARLPTRRACTRATGTVDSVFYRTSGGTVRIKTASNTAEHIAPMRPPCHDGVIISDGMLYWGPWMCGCQLSLYGHICLAPAGRFDFHPGVDSSRLELGPGNVAKVEPLEVRPGDWPAGRGNSRRTAAVAVAIPRQVSRQWASRVARGVLPTAPVTAGGLVFLGDRAGVVRALDAATGEPRWKAYTGGAIFCPPAVSQGRLYAGSADGRVYAFEAATGRLLWRFRLAPAERWISVYGQLVSTWPVAGGVVAEDGVVYAAAGIAHYDGTHVVALDAVTGKVKWYNDSSGTTSEKVNSGASLQGELYLAGGELRFVGGGVHETARYDLKTGRCLNPPRDAPNSSFHTSFYAYYPWYGQYVSLDHTFDDGRSLVYDASYEGSQHGNLSLLPPGAPKPAKPVSRWPVRRGGGPQPKPVWSGAAARRFNAFVVTPEVLLTAGQHLGPELPRAFLAAIRVADGSDVWRQQLPAPVVKGGTAVDHAGRIFVALQDGSVLCFAGSATSKSN